MGKDYEVGYGKPPKHGQFKKGRSGNPKGRPKGGRSKGSVVRDVLGRKVTIREKGRSREVDGFEALVQSTFAQALGGSMNDKMKMFQLIEKHAPDMLADMRNVDRPMTVRFIKSDGNGRPANREDWQDWQWESHRQEVEERNNDPKVIAAWKAAGLDDDDEASAS